jgi:hypothetical protein
MSHLTQGPFYLKRLAIHLSPGTHRFLIPKETVDPVLLTGWIFSVRNRDSSNRLSSESASEGGLVPPLVLNADLDLPLRSSHDLLEEWTIARRSLTIHHQGAGRLPLFGTRDQVDAGQLFFIPLGRDLPPGTYPLRLTLTGGSGGYLVLSSTQAGRHPTRQFFQEPALDGIHESE